MAAKPTRLTHKIALQLHLVAESCTICSSRSRRPVRKLLAIPSYKLKPKLEGLLCPKAMMMMMMSIVLHLLNMEIKIELNRYLKKNGSVYEILIRNSSSGL
jgi:hypothetical protein